MRRVIELDSEFAPAWRELSRLLWRRIGAGPSLEEDIAAMHDALVRARSIAPDDAATLAYLGWYTADFDGDVVGGAQLFERALSLGLSNEKVVRTSATFARAFAKLEPYGFIILLILFYSGFLPKIIFPIITFTQKLIV